MPISQLQQNKHTQSAASRIGALATLPVFFDLNEKRVLLIGGSEAATWKAELLAAAGAKIDVHAVEFCVEMRSLAARTDLNGSITLICQPWSLRAFAGKSLVIGDAQSEGEAKAIYCAARAAGVPVNVIDKPAYCTFKFGTIVNRSPVVIGISTDGAAPVLGQAIRTKIEALLPATLANWAAYAKEIRATVLAHFELGTLRRQFWANFAKLAFGPFAPDAAWSYCATNVQKSAAGSVEIMRVDAHDPSLLTLKAVSLLQLADIVFYDKKVNFRILDFARREASRREIMFSQTAKRKNTSLHEEVAAHVSCGKVVAIVLADMQQEPSWRDFKKELENQKTEAKIGVRDLNRMTKLDRVPRSP